MRQVENKNVGAINIGKHGMPFEGRRAFMGPAIREGHHITFTFQLPSLLEEYGKKAEDYWGHLLGHEGPGSLLSALKARRWATGLSAGLFCYLFFTACVFLPAGAYPVGVRFVFVVH